MPRPSAVLAVLLSAAPALGQGYPPEQAAGKMAVPPGFRVSLVAGEPLVRQPVAIDFDDRGRLWVMQYLQYPNPAGLTRAKVDRFSRTVYDRVPEPPPRGPKGADRLTILEPDSDGKMRAKDFVSGLNLASAFAFGHGGVFVLQVPYLLFYPDRDRDDVPDSDPDVLLTGFGMEDAHSVANSLTWGPDGWLYGCQGSTVTANIRGIEFQQGVWRYHPITRKFELFCEGGGNSWGLDFDRRGHLLYSTNHGGYTMLHGVQGGYYWKSFGKHGELHNPFAYGFIDHVPHAHFKGGHVTVGGIVYRGDNFPPAFRDKSIGADLLGHGVYWHHVEPAGSSFRSRHGGELLLANDTWFAPSDVCLGPDGCVYVADWHDARTAHPDPDAEWDRRNGRVYRISYGNPPPVRGIDLSKLKSDELVKLFGHRNDWYARTARRVLADRRDPEVIFPLRTLVLEAKDDDLALQALWALYVSGGFNEPFAQKLLGHRNPGVRRWAVRLLGDEGKVSPDTAKAFEQLAAGDPDPHVRSQLACTAKRLPAADAVPILRRLALREEDAADPHIPLLLWWAVEHHAVAAREALVPFFVSAEAWAGAIARDAILPRLVRRYAAEGMPGTDAACVALLRSAPGDRDRIRLLQSLELGLKERGSVAVAAELASYLRELAAKSPGDPLLLRLLARLGDAAARNRLLARCLDRTAPAIVRTELLAAVGEVGTKADAAKLLPLISASEPEAVQFAALAAWQRLGADGPADSLLAAYPSRSPVVKARLRSVLLSRKAWAAAALAAVDAGRLPAADFTVDELRAVNAYGDRGLDALVHKHWGSVRPPTPEEKLAEVRRLNNDLRAAPGDPATGRLLFTKHCATCHKLGGEGGAVGPDLTFANRGDRQFLLVSLVDPSGVVRKEFASYTLETTDGRTLTGLVAEQSAAAVTLIDAKAQKTTVPRAEVASLRESPVSLMPENLLKELKPQELRDLFAYLQAPAPAGR